MYDERPRSKIISEPINYSFDTNSDTNSDIESSIESFNDSSNESSYDCDYFNSNSDTDLSFDAYFNTRSKLDPEYVHDNSTDDLSSNSDDETQRINKMIMNYADLNDNLPNVTVNNDWVHIWDKLS